MKTDLHCRFCGVVTGSVEFNDWQNFKAQEFEDVRCSLCQNLYGTYQDMEQKYAATFGDQNFKQFIKDSNYKQSEFDTNINKKMN